jgi:hypothetical protein
MLLLVSCLICSMTALALVILRVTQPNARYAWLVANGGAILALVSVLSWPAQMPFSLSMFRWRPEVLFPNPILFQIDGLSWPYALSLSVTTLAVLLTAVARPAFTNSYAWAGTLGLSTLGLLAVTANNSLTLLLIWGVLDITELLIQLRTVDGPANSEKVVISFFTRALGIGILLWTNIISISSGGGFDFASISPAAGLYLVIAAGLRLGVLPLHPPYSPESTLRRGFGSSLRLVSVASSLAVLSRIPAESMNSGFTPFLMIVTVLAAVYAGWMWLRAPEELNGHPYWIIGMAALSIIAVLNDNPTGAVAWGCALILAGAALFLSSVQQLWMNRILMIGAFALSSLPFSLTASAWSGSPDILSILALVAQGLLIAGYIRHALRPSGRDTLDAQPNWTRTVYPAGIYILVGAQLLLGLVGWDGALQIGNWIFALVVCILSILLVWATPRFRILNPIRAHWLGSASSRPWHPSNVFGGIHRWLTGISMTLNSMLEGDGGIMWTLLFLVLFVSLMTQGVP